MKTLMYGLTLFLGTAATDVVSEVKLNVDGAEFELAALMENCRTLSDQPDAQIACFNAVSKLLDEQSNRTEAPGPSVSDALNGLRTSAQYADAESGLTIVGDGCEIQVLYYNNYFHLSRRNVSTIDLFSASFDAARLQPNQTTEFQNGPVTFVKAVLEDGVLATTQGGVALDSTQQNFDPKPARTEIGAYASEVVPQLVAREGQNFEFVLVHPARAQAKSEIWAAFKEFVKACKKL